MTAINMPPALLVNEQKEFVYASFHLDEQGLTPIGTPTKEQWLECGRFLKSAEESVHFWIGDWARYGDLHFRQDYQQLETITGYNYHTIRRDKYLCERIPPERRRSHMDVAFHHEVAPLHETLQEELLEKVAREKLTVQQLRVEKHRIVLEQKRQKESGMQVPDSGLYVGDCLQLLPTLPDESVDLLLTDPPYGLDYQSEHRLIPQEKIANDTPQEAQSVLDQALSLAYKKLKPNSHIYIFSDNREVILWMYPLVAKYFEVKNELVWVKNNHTGGDLAANYAHKYEMLIFAQKGRRHLYGNRDSDILFFDRVPENAPNRHPNEKPVKLLEYLIEKSTLEGETVLDPFMGSGSTCVAAKNMNRKYIGIEVQQQWYDVARQRLARSAEIRNHVVSGTLPAPVPAFLSAKIP